MEPTRGEFLHITGFQQPLFYLLVLGSLAYAAWTIASRARIWMQGKPIDWKPQIVPNILVYILAQRKVRSSRHKSGAPMHLLIFYGFLSLLIATTLLAINTYSPFKFHQGAYYLGYEFVFDTLGLLLVIGVGWAIVRRNGFRPRTLISNWKDNWALTLLFTLGFTGYLLEAARISNNPKSWDGVSWVGNSLAAVLPRVSDGAYIGIWWFHAILVVALFASLPHMRLRHIVMAAASASGHPNDQPRGELKPISMEEVEQTGQIGVALAKDYSRWHLMSLDACMECGRCTEVCPANRVGKPLDPRAVVQAIRGAAVTGENVPAAITEEALWACTTCNACVEACPVLIRHVDLIVDARRNLVAEGHLSGTAATMLRQTASAGNAFGAAGDREAWMSGLSVPLAREKRTFDVLFWVGCAGATDPGAIRTTQAVATLLGKAGIDFACMGNEEKCTGDPARRVGDEFQFQEMAMGNVAAMGQYEFKTIVTACPHCLNTLKNEYGQFEGKYRVVHHSQLLAELVAQGKLQGATGGQTVTYHDPCYLARVNGIADAPRFLLGAGKGQPLRMVEPEHRGVKTLCCGAGGGRMWMEEPPEQRPGNSRAEELLATGAKTVALACPFCRIMLDASIKQVTDEEIRLVDLAELLQESNA